jgi:hypothetical protein
MWWQSLEAKMKSLKGWRAEVIYSSGLRQPGRNLVRAVTPGKVTCSGTTSCYKSSFSDVSINFFSHIISELAITLSFDQFVWYKLKSPIHNICSGVGFRYIKSSTYLKIIIIEYINILLFVNYSYWIDI